MYKNFHGCKNISSSRWPIFFRDRKRYNFVYNMLIYTYFGPIPGGGIPSTRSSRNLVDNEMVLTYWPNVCSVIFGKCMLIYSYFRPFPWRGSIPLTRSSPRLAGNEIFLTHWPNLWSIIYNKCMTIYTYIITHLGRGHTLNKKFSSSRWQKDISGSLINYF